jgi:hypothetical protein
MKNFESDRGLRFVHAYSVPPSGQWDDSINTEASGIKL